MLLGILRGRAGGSPVDIAVSQRAMRRVAATRLPTCWFRRP